MLSALFLKEFFSFAFIFLESGNLKEQNEKGREREVHKRRSGTGASSLERARQHLNYRSSTERRGSGAQEACVGAVGRESQLLSFYIIIIIINMLRHKLGWFSPTALCYCNVSIEHEHTGN